MKITRQQLRMFIREAVEEEKSSIDVEEAGHIPPDALIVPDPLNPEEKFILGIKDKVITLYHQGSKGIIEIEPDSMEFNKALGAMLKRIQSKNDKNALRVFKKKYIQKMFPTANLHTVISRLTNLVD